MMIPVRITPDVRKPFWAIRYMTRSSNTLISVGFLITCGTTFERTRYRAIAMMTGRRVSESNIFTLHN